MITEEHLNYWISELKYSLNGIRKEISKEKVIMKGINVGKNGEAFVLFEYLQEKTFILAGTIRCIENDMKND